jgi:membrane fusion protein (multidrug efflux system)
LRKALKDGLLKGPAEGQATVKLLFDDGSEYPRPGRLLFSESTVDETTGQITMRAEFPNPDGDLLPGMYVRVLIEQAVDQAALTVPEQAVQRDSSGKALLYVVGEDNVAQMRPVTVGRTTGQQVVITGGLKSGERVVVEGFQKIHPGAKVEPADWKPAADTLSRTQSKADAG